MKVDVEVGKELLLHANSRITLEFYEQAVTDAEREAQELALKRFLGSTLLQHPPAPSSTQIEAKKAMIAMLEFEVYMVGTTGFEPATSSVSRKRSNQLSYAPIRDIC
jgi:hypothetical protein